MISFSIGSNCWMAVVALTYDNNSQTLLHC